ncbi:hypothetical protein [Dietzia timorensis]|uniref:hypothetical protein n=1 Tax=Dietzia timorensis TaxID=499555 RepID=UPI0012E93DDF|nr:hypothetical protein [Dietzia timorensis]
MKSNNAAVFFCFEDPCSWLLFEQLRNKRPDMFKTISWMPVWKPSPLERRYLDLYEIRLPYLSRGESAEAYARYNAKRMAQSYGFPSTEKLVEIEDWSLPHRGLRLAGLHNREVEYIQAINVARWNEFQSIGELATILECLLSAEVPSVTDVQELSEMLDSPISLLWGKECLRKASRKGVFDTPFMEFQGHRFLGLERVDEFISAYDNSD